MLLTRLAKGFQAGHARHAHVRDHHADSATAQNLERVFTGSHRHGVEALALQKGVQQAALSGVVIDDQEARPLQVRIVRYGAHGVTWPLRD